MACVLHTGRDHEVTMSGTANIATLTGAARKLQREEPMPTDVLWILARHADDNERLSRGHNVEDRRWLEACPGATTLVFKQFWPIRGVIAKWAKNDGGSWTSALRLGLSRHCSVPAVSVEACLEAHPQSSGS